jgi:alkylhydroperoxidase family enzyme
MDLRGMVGTDSNTPSSGYAIPRLGLDQMEPELAEMLRPRVERLGYLGEFFQCTAIQPAALKSFYRFTEDLKKALPERLTEAVSLTVAASLGNAYERVQHERLSLKLGFGKQWVRGVLSRQPGNSSTPLSDTERKVQTLALSVLHTHGNGAAAQLEDVARVLGPAQAIAVLMLIGRYTAHALIANCLGIEPPVRSPLEEES